MAIAVALVPLAFDRMRDSAQYRSTLRSVATELRTARHRSSTDGIEVGFVADLTARTFGVVGGPLHEVPASIELRATVAAPELSEGRAVIRFLPDGGATGGSIELIRSSGAGGRLRVDWMTGRVTTEPLLP